MANKCEIGCRCLKHTNSGAKPSGRNTYSIRHRHVRLARGKASAHDCVRCSENNIGKQAREWAQIHGTDGLDPWADYIPLCVPCHAVYDNKSDTMARAIKKAWSEGKYDNRLNARPDVAIRNIGNHYAGNCPVNCNCGKHKQKKSASGG